MDLLQGLTVAVLVLLALAGMLVLAQRRGWVQTGRAGGSQRRLQTIERLPLGPQHAIHLVRIDEKVVVVASAPGGCSLLELGVSE